MARLFTVLQAVSKASREIGISQQDAKQALASRDEDTSQMAAMLSSIADDLLIEEPYQETLGDGFWLRARNGALLSEPTADDDLILFDGRLVVCGLKYKFLQAKGLEFGEQLRDYTTRLNKLAVRANDRVLDLDFDEGRVV